MEADGRPQITSASSEVSPVDRWRELDTLWAELNRELLNYVDDPEHPRAEQIVKMQQEISAEMSSLDLPTELADTLGGPGGVKDVVIVGAGLAGLSAAIYGGSEGLDTLLVDASETPGGQAALSSRIENFIAFPTGITGAELTERALEQAKRLKADVKLGLAVTGMEYQPETGYKRLSFADGSSVVAKAVVLATGAQFRKLNFPGSDCEGIVYGSSGQMKKLGGHGDLVIIGGGNSAGQAALDAAREAEPVTILVRSGSLQSSMSDYLIDQVTSTPNIQVKRGEIESASRDEHGHIEAITLKGGEQLPCRSLGIFIGSSPQMEWAGVELDERGRVVSGEDGRPELEASMPGVFTVGDARSMAMQRTVTAVADGAEAVSYAYHYIQSIGIEQPRVTSAAPAVAERMTEQDQQLTLSGF